uniref:ABC transporter permease subunit n=1 Tax=Thermofilum pendens TaxID=2269 RepID=A0A7C4B914_THEPE
MRARSIKRRLADLAVHLLTAASALAILGAAGHILLSALIEGLPVLLRGASFFLEPPGPPGGDVGGVSPSLAGTLVTVAIATLASTALGVPAGVMLSEARGSPLARAAERAVELIAESPSIVVGLVVFTLLVVPMRTPSALAAAVSLSVVALPYVAAQVRESLAAIPLVYREAAFSLGLPKWKTVFLLLIPMNARGVATAVLLGSMRALGETAPVLFTAGAAFQAFYGIDKPSSTLSLLVFFFAGTPYENWRKLAWGAVLLLAMLSTSLAFLTRRLSSGVRM